ncbi:MAG: hydrogenase [Patescibacteria group bacterium]|nr:hydrogenase [Patescibacteria group bacterium]
MPVKKNKKILSIISLTCCEGCQFAILDLGEKMLKLFKHYDVREFHLIQDDKKAKAVDVIIVEGTPITKENFKKLKKARQKAKYLIALGSCAHLGGIQQIKNYGDKKKHLDYVYDKPAGINNPEIKPISHFVKVDFTIPGCPINNKEFLRVMYDLAQDKIPHIEDKAVCWECQLRGNECLLQKGLPCYGPVSLGGCQAVCPTHGFPCYACRGPIKKPNVKSLRQIFKKHGLEKDFEILMQEFGAADEILKKEK